MKVSVALCTYNGEKYINQQLESILTQSYPVDEIIITDDNSTDKTADIIRDFKELHNGRISFQINKSNVGAKKNFEIAISKCRGDIIFLSDQDDIWLHNKVSEVLKMFKENPQAELVFSDGLLIDESDREIGSTLFKEFYFHEGKAQNLWKKGNALEELLNGAARITGATVALKRELFNRAMPFNLPKIVWHDAWLGIHAAVDNHLLWTNTPLIKYRLHSSQQVGLGNFLKETSEERKSLRDLLIDVKHNQSVWLEITELLLKQYPISPLKKIRKNKIKTLRLVEMRLFLPNKFFERAIRVLSNIHLYFGSLGKPVRSIFRDILKPA